MSKRRDRHVRLQKRTSHLCWRNYSKDKNRRGKKTRRNPMIKPFRWLAMLLYWQNLTYISHSKYIIVRIIYIMHSRKYSICSHTTAFIHVYRTSKMCYISLPNQPISRRLNSSTRTWFTTKSYLASSTTQTLLKL